MGRNQRDEGGLRMTAATLKTSHGAAELADSISANGSANVSITNVAPAAVTTATISQWLQVDVDGGVFYIPMWT